MRGLYPVLDLSTLLSRKLEVSRIAEAVMAVRPPLLQLRAKQAPARQVVEVLRQLVPRCAERGTLLFANDRPDLAVVAGAAGVHVGQEDLTLAEVRRFAPNLKIGVSTHNLEQLRSALAEAPSYVAYGPVFRTVTKENPDPVVGVDGLAEAARLAEQAGVPLVAIGGITLERAPALAPLGVMAAVIGGLFEAGTDLEAVTGRAWALHRLMGGA